MLKKHLSALSQIEVSLKQLHLKAELVDQHNKHLPSHKIIKERLVFTEYLFVSQSEKFVDYVSEINQNALKLKKLLQDEKFVLAQNLLEKIENQITSIINALHSNTLMHNEASNHEALIKKIKKSRYQKLTNSIVESSQTLYKSLSEHHEFERRLMDMLTNKEQELAKASTNKTTSLSQEVLVLHQRLGRCRQAISKIERSIELSEKRI